MFEQNNKSPQERYYILDAVRFFAGMAVLFYHFFSSGPSDTVVDISKQFVPISEFPELYPLLKFGFLGVNLFFIISGFVIFASALNRNAISFAILRWIRLYPTYWAAILLTTLAHYFYNADIFNISLPQFIANLTMLNDYMGFKNIDPVYWTLHVELQFYACIFALILLKALNHYKIWLTIWLLACTLYAFTAQPFFLSWIISPDYSSYFISGAVFYLARKQGYDWFLITILFFSYILTLVSISAQVDLYTVNTTVFDKVTGAAIVSLFYIFFLFFSVGKFNINKSKILLLLGGITYPLYLIHLVVGRRLMDSLYGSMNNYVIVGITIISMFALALLIHILIDKKLCGILRIKLLSLPFVRK